MGCRNALLPDHLLKERFINCLTCGQNTCDNLIFLQILGVRRENSLLFPSLHERERKS